MQAFIHRFLSEYGLWSAGGAVLFFVGSQELGVGVPLAAAGVGAVVGGVVGLVKDLVVDQ